MLAVEITVIPGDKAERPSAYYQAIVVTGEAVLAHDDEQRQANNISPQ